MKGKGQVKERQQILSHKWIRECKLIMCINNARGIYIAEHNGEEYLIFRSGECNYKKCKAACCRFCHVADKKNTYWEGFGKKSNWGIKILVKCNKLNGNKCKVFGTDKFPKACKEFPHPNDETYLLVMNKCSFRFKLEGKIVKR